MYEGKIIDTHVQTIVQSVISNGYKLICKACTACESMLLYSHYLHHRLIRECNKEYKYGKITIPKGCSIMFPVPLMHKNPEYWKDPEKFDPMR